MSKRITTIAFTLLSTIAWIGAAKGALINVQFSTGAPYSGAAVIGATGDFWNPITTNGAGAALNNSANVLTGVTLDNSSAGIGDFGTPSGAPFNASPYVNLFRGITGTDASISITLHSVPTGAYDLYLYSAANYPESLAPGVQARTLIASATTSFGTVGPLTIGPNSNVSTLVQGTNWIVLHPVVGVSGVLTITGVQGGTGDNLGDLNGFQLVSVAAPEPSGLVLISVAGIGFLIKLRGRRS